MNTIPQFDDDLRLINKKQLCAKVNLTFPFIWSLIRRGKFPEGRAIGSRTLWVKSEVDDWILAQARRTYRKTEAR